ncbi:MAG: hypothetical protein KF906_07970 [Actinobacteria bacterium]|nr:hypothetical protein [Actinomycetota bacterium]
MWWALAALFVVVVAAAGAGYLAVKATRTVRSNYEQSNQVVPGTPTAAPTSWLGSHDPEARLHRRLIDAVRALRANQQFDTLGTYLDLRVELEQQAVMIDNELVAVAALPIAQRQEPLAKLTEAVESIEVAIGELARTSAQSASDQLARTLDGLRERSTTLEEAKAALDELDRRAEPSPDEAPGTAAGGDPA